MSEVLRPNVIFVLMDDMGYGDMGCYGSAAIRTPVMDGIASRGVRFTQMYAAAPICTPSRAALMTGLYAQRVGLPRVLFPDETAGLESRFQTVAEALRAEGYATQAVGKWHLGCMPEHRPTRHGFDTFFGLPYSNDMNPLHLYKDEEVLETEVDQAQLTERYTREVIRFVEDHVARSPEKPFFSYLAHTMPHIPLHVPAEFRGKSRAGIYGDTIECIDHFLGILLERLRALGIEENTLVVVTSDNGPWYEGSTAGLRGRKFDCYEGGVRMPFVAQLPGTIPPGSVCREVASFMDMLPTFVGLAGGTPATGLDGRNSWPLFIGEGSSPHDVLFYYMSDTPNAVRQGKWKLHVGAGPRSRLVTKEMPQLFDMDLDPGESYNLARNHPDIVERLRALLEAFDKEIQPVPNSVRLQPGAAAATAEREAQSPARGGAPADIRRLPAGWT